MSKTTTPTADEIRQRGHAALLRELGPVGYARFLRQLSNGHGDYTAERREWVGSVDLTDLRARADDEMPKARAVKRGKRRK
ncbi:MAG: hypothetical protein ACAI43_08645 [Phycisphaerae bacterium]|nr:hypothetical protein [Tepidisphaeraceae bacterium]